MGMLAPMVNDGGMVRRLAAGDLLVLGEPPIPATDTTNTTLALTAAMLLNSTCYCRNPAGVSTDTFPTADALITALNAGIGAANVVPGMTFRWTMINLSANVITTAVTANTGVTLTRGTVAAGAAGAGAAPPGAARSRHLGRAVRRHRLHPLQPRGAGRDVARPVRRAVRWSGGAPAGDRRGSSPRRQRRLRLAARRSWDRRSLRRCSVLRSCAAA